MLESKIIEFKGMPLFQKARFKSPFIMRGAIKDFACFFYMTEGRMLSYDARGLHQISATEAVMKQCGNYVQKYIADESTEECEAIAIYLYPELLKEIYKNELPTFLKDADPQRHTKKYIGNQLIEQYMKNLAIYFESPETLDEELGILKLKELMMILLKSENHENIRLLLSEIFSPVDIEFRNAIEKNLFNNLSLDQLAFICNMSLSTFKRSFKKAFGNSPAKYIKDRRLQQAALLLRSTEENITSIAYDSGFQDVTTFSSVFTIKYGMPPSKYRMSQNRM